MNAPLAILGGPPTVLHEGPHFSWPPLDERTGNVVLDQLHESISIYDRSGVIERLEEALCRYFGVRHAVLASSGTAALHSMYVAAGIGPGDEVVVPAYTFLATATPLLQVGATPVLADCDESGNLSVEAAARQITSRTVAIVVTHMWGMPADVEGLRRLADMHDLLLLEDGSHAHGASIGGRKVGTFGHAGAFSMNGPKPLSAGEGGFVLTDDDECCYRLLLHGHYNKRCRNEIPESHPLHRYAVTGMGLKFRIHPIAAAIALDQLGKLDEYLAGRAAMARYLIDCFADMPGIRAPVLADGIQAAWYGLPLTYVPEELGGVVIDSFRAAVQSEGCREVDQPGSTCPLNLLPLFQEPSPLFPEYLSRMTYRPGEFPVAERIWSHTLKLPVWHREEGLPLAAAYVEAFRKVTSRAHDLWRVSA